MRGVYLRPSGSRGRTDGSSPHARGLLLPAPACDLPGGIIPACAGFTLPLPALGGVDGDHPRMRGVYRRTSSRTVSSSGSSPHARGLRVRDVHGRLRLRIIPACAGVYAPATTCGQTCSGSSPHARGLQDLRRGCDRGEGIIPACAGFTPTTCYATPRTPDHPRMRGVYEAQCVREVGDDGSSPHARGLPHVAGAVRLGHGIIPACAGFTTGSCRPPPGPTDHPRMRGVYAPAVSVAGSLGGSSPHARGLHHGPPAGRGLVGIIPACAGFTRDAARGGADVRDHPRMRGVYGVPAVGSSSEYGSSPHARGLRGGRRGRRRAQRIIPACAGFTSRRPRRRPPCPDHPRMRGVYTETEITEATAAGSSPHARGLPRRRIRPDGGGRIIPACAGFTPGAATQ